MKKIIYSFIIVTFVLLNLFIEKGFAQKRIDSVMQIYSERYQPERTYFQFNQPAYTVGDIIWFKGYIMSGIYPAWLSKNMYVDFSDNRGNLLAHLVYPIINGGSFGQFTIPDSLKGSSLHMCGYTNWMRNFDTCYIFNKDIKIVRKESMSTPQILNNKTSITFFPEGGNLVAGVVNNVAFKANDQHGVPVAISGSVYDSKNNKVADFAPQHDGMGQFQFTPVANEVYIARYKNASDIDSVALPTVEASGVVMQIREKGNKNLIKIVRSDQVTESQQELHLMASIEQKTVYLSNIQLKDHTEFNGQIDVSNFPTGIMQVTVFDKNWIPLSERVCFVGHLENKIIRPEIKLVKVGLQKRDSNEYVLKFNHTSITNLSISITDSALGSNNDGDNIITHFLLTGQLHGAIYHPNYYFSDTTIQKKRDLDLVMLTHGWRKYDWSMIVKDAYPQIKYPADTSYLYFSGKISGLTAKQLSKVGDLLVFAKPMGADTVVPTKIITVPINEDGSFRSPNTFFYGRTSISYQFTKKKSLTHKAHFDFVQSDTNIAGVQPTNNYEKLNEESSRLLIYQKNMEDSQFVNDLHLDTVKIKVRKINKVQLMDKRYTTGVFSDKSARSFDLLNDSMLNTYFDLEQYLQWKVPGIRFESSEISSIDKNAQWKGFDVQFYLNQIEVPFGQIYKLPLVNIAYIKAYDPPFIGSHGFSPKAAIGVFLRKAGDISVNDIHLDSLSSKIINTYSVIKQFYAPNYDGEENNGVTDIRTTLYWNPFIYLDAKNNEFQIKFKNNDVTKAFRIVLEGIDANGKLIHEERIVN